MALQVKKPSRTSTRAVGRPRQFDEARVLDAAVELFWDGGYRATTTRDLEDALGIRQSSLYNAFGSKQGLLDAALDRYEEMTSRELLEPLESAEDGVASIDRFFGALTQWVTQKGRGGCMLVNMMAEDGGSSPEVTQRCHSYRQRVRGAFRQGLKRAAESGEISDEALTERTDLLLGLVLGLNIAARGGAGKSEITRILGAVRAQLASWRS